VSAAPFSIGSTTWPGTTKVIEEAGELLQVLGKLLVTDGTAQHWDGDLEPRIVEEVGDLMAALSYFASENLQHHEVTARIEKKRVLFRKWHNDERAEPDA
jgi:hypothetical protein